ncbi:response regulator transcription factor [Kribbella speibonae]|uniref:Response regulator transcription factor n=1 Tax=Kribbella speibonae TaxID=1572660 RepID=A0ABY1ZVI2_9ACTN|nr:response regulator transcription factor [Kribbella speibonae]TCC18296.1 response regulator transcription factor [Kribbella speibonae]
MSMPITVVVVDGHTLTRYGLVRLVTADADITIVGECGLAAEAPALIASTHPDVVVLDVALPDADGLQLARELRDRHHELGIVVLTGQAGDDVLFRALETGVSAFVGKTAPNTEVLGAIRHAAVAAASFTATGLGPALARRGQAGDVPFGGSVGAQPACTALSPRELEVLSLLATGLSVPAMAATMFVSLSTAKTYVSRVYEKLGATNRANAIMTAMRLGLIKPELGVSA